MKQLLFFFGSFLLLIIFSCKKENTTTTDTLFGKWQWQYSTQEAMTENAKPTPGVVSLLILNADHTYSATENGTVVSSGTFKDTSYSNPTGRMLLLSNNILLDNTDIGSGLWITQPNTQTLDLSSSYDLDYVGFQLMRHFTRVQ